MKFCNSDNFLGMPKTLENLFKECENDDNARKTYNQFVNLVQRDSKKEWISECPVPCEQTIFDLKLEKYHQNSIVKQGNSSHPLVSKGVMFLLQYDKFVIEEHVETLIYDTGNFLAQAGGNLGLFLGFSCLSMLLSIVNLGKKMLLNCN